MYLEYLKLYLEMAKIYKELIINPGDCYNIEELYRRYSRLSVRLGTNKPIYNEGIINQHGNCYTYALGIQCPDLFYKTYDYVEIDNMPFNVGLFGGDNSGRIKSEDILLEKFYADCDYLDIKVYDSDFKQDIEHNGYKIAMYFKPQNYDFHFIRQNADGIWSDKLGYGGMVRIMDLEKGLRSYDLVKTVEIVKPVIRERSLKIN